MQLNTNTNVIEPKSETYQDWIQHTLARLSKASTCSTSAVCSKEGSSDESGDNDYEKQHSEEDYSDGIHT